MTPLWISLVFFAICYWLFKWAMTLHSVPGSIILFVSGGFGLAGVFTCGIAASFLFR